MRAKNETKLIGEAYADVLAEQWQQAAGKAALAAGKALAPHAKTIGKAAVAGLAAGAYEGAKRRADRIASGEKVKEDNGEIEDEESPSKWDEEGNLIRDSEEGHRPTWEEVKAAQAERAAIQSEDPVQRKKDAQRAANERARKQWEKPEYWKEFNVPGLGPDTPKEDENNEEPKRGISGYEHKTDALVSARKAGAIHKPYVSSFVSDGGKIFGVMGSDGKIVHKTRDKQKAYKWLKDNYEDI